MPRHRAVVRADHAGPARSARERRLERIQTSLTKLCAQVNLLTSERDHLILDLWLQENVPQAELAERLDRIDRQGGGPGISYAATQKRMWRARNDELAETG